MPTVQINGHDLYYEIHGRRQGDRTGETALCMGGWGTYCHGGERHLARGLTDRYRVLIIDYRGIGASTDDLSEPPTMLLHATTWGGRESTSSASWAWEPASPRKAPSSARTWCAAW